MKAELQQLVALQNLDISLRRLQADLEALPQRRAEIETEFDQRAFEIRAVETLRDNAHHERTRIEMEVAEQRAKAERADRNLMSSKKQDEYTAAIREADAARKQIAALDTLMLEQMEVFEKAEASLAERASEIATLNSDREARLRAFDEEVAAQETLLETSRVERERVFSALPKTMSALYNRIRVRIRDGIAMAEARNGACAACFMALRPQVMAQVRRGEEVVTCDHCNRILYFIPANNAATTPSASAQKTATT